MIRTRDDIAFANRIVIKAGTTVISTQEGYPSLSRMAGIVENAARLVLDGKEVLLVTSGAVGVGRQKLSRQATLRQSMSSFLAKREPTVATVSAIATIPAASGKIAYNSACAAAGQLGIMSLYETMFSQFDITVSQVLVTASDFASVERRKNIQYVISQLLALGIVPILNENDAVSANQGYETFDSDTFSDNDSLAALVSIEMSAQLLILLTDVKGVYDRPPSEPDAQIIDIYREGTDFKVGAKSLQGRGGMSAKVDAALRAVNHGVQAVVIAAGNENGIIDCILRGDTVGTMFLQHHDTGNGGTEDCTAVIESVTKAIKITELETKHRMELLASCARDASRLLQSQSAEMRTKILLTLAQYIQDREEEILSANERDLEAAKESGLAATLLMRLKLTSTKLHTLVEGIRSIAKQADPVDQLLSKTELADGLILDKVSCPIGVLLIIFESRPDCLPQIAALAMRSGNGLLLKGGKEAEHSNACLYAIIQDAIHDGSDGLIPKGVIGLVTSRNDINLLLQMDKHIDLVIPRGGNDLVSFIKKSTTIPVLSHADGVCHVYVDKECDLTKALRIVVDSKTDYPSACNAMECLLVHKDLIESGVADKLLRTLRSAGVSLFGGPIAMSHGLTDQSVVDFHTEYSDLRLSVEVVDSVEKAVEHINLNGSGHTECIVSDNTESIDYFMKNVDSACIFHNASTRFADGYRFGLGAEVGISTGRIHARGPVGVGGLMTTKYQLRSISDKGHTVASFAVASNSGVHSIEKKCVYTHKKLNV